MVGINLRATWRLCSLIKPNNVKRAVTGQTAACWWKKSGTQKNFRRSAGRNCFLLLKNWGKKVIWLKLQVNSKLTLCSWLFFLERFWIGMTLCSFRFSTTYLNWNDFCVHILILHICWIENSKCIAGEPENATFFSLFHLYVSVMCSPQENLI